MPAVAKYFDNKNGMRWIIFSYDSLNQSSLYLPQTLFCARLRAGVIVSGATDAEFSRLYK
jgi:hypothetical protein